MDIENTPIINTFRGIPRYFSLGPRKIFRGKPRYFRPLKSHVGQTAEIFRVNLRYFSTFSVAAKHFGDNPDIAELQATFGRRKRSKNTGDVCKNGRISGKTPKFFVFL